MVRNFLRSLYGRWRDHTWRGPRLGWLVAFALVLVLGLSAMIAAGLAGLNQGLSDRQVSQQSEVQAHFQKGLAHIDAGRPALALAEFEMVLRLDPAHPQAGQYLRSLRATLTPESSAGSSVAPQLAPAPTMDPSLLSRETLFEQAQAAIQAEDWLAAQDVLERLVALDATYRVADVEGMRFGAAFQHGLALAGTGDYAGAVSAFDTSLELRPGDLEAEQQRRLAAFMAAALATWGQDWQATVDSLEAVQELQPDYGDATGRLAAAQEAWGDVEARRLRPCEAAAHYAAAVQAEASAARSQKQRQAQEACAQPAATPSPSPTATPPATRPASPTAEPTLSPTAEPAVTPSPTPQVEGSSGPAPLATRARGNLFFASFNDEFDRWTIYRWNLRDATEPEPLAQGASQPAISPDTGRLAVRSERGDAMGLAIISADGTSRSRLTTFAEDSHPQWSPDGRQLVFDSNREGDRRWRIYLTWLDGEAWAVRFGRWPSWSPQGDVLAYQGCDDTGNRCGLWLMGNDGSNLRPLTDVPADAMPDWSPAGSRLAFASAQRSGSWDIYLLDVESGQVSPLVGGDAVDAHPVWSPDGSQIAFLSNRNGAWGVYVVEVASRQVFLASPVPGVLPDWLEAELSWGL